MDLLYFAKIYLTNLVTIGLIAGFAVFALLTIFGPAPRGDMAHGFQYLFNIVTVILTMFAAATAYTLYNKEEYID